MKNPPPTEFVIRRAVPSEAPALTALARRSKAYWGYSKEFMRSFEEELTYSGEQVECSNLTFFVGEANGAMGGFYALSRVSPLEYELEALFVEPERIGQGLGRALLEHGKNTVRSFGGESLIVQADPHTEGFYRAGGGERIGTRESGSVANRFLPLFRIFVRESR